MKTAIGSTFMYNIIIIFIVIVFAFLTGIMSYYKAFKVNNGIVYIIEKYEGYNDLARTEIQRYLNNLGYSQDLRNLNCSNYSSSSMTTIEEANRSHRYCIYIDNAVTTGNHGAGTYYEYAVRTYMQIDLPVVNMIRIPITTRTNQIYKFTTDAPILRFN